MTPQHRSRLLLLSTLLATAPTLAAQEPSRSLEARVRALEASAKAKDARIHSLEHQLGHGAAEASHAQDPETAGKHRSDDHEHGSFFDNALNPSVRLVGDFVVSATDRDDNFESHNQFSLRDAELGLVGRIDPAVSYHFYAHFSEEDISLEEAYLLADDLLPNSFELKAGRYNIDFGRLSPVHDHHLPFVDKPQVLQEYLGGALRGTGLQLGHEFDAGESTQVRWSVGVANSLDGDSHAIFGPAAGHEHGDEGAEPFGDRDLENFGFHGRVAARFGAGAHGKLQVGASVAWAPESRSFFESGSSTIAADLESLIAGVDVTYRAVDPETGSGFVVGGEFLLADTESSDDGITINQNESAGFYGYVERHCCPDWSFGASGGLYEHAEDDTEESWDAGAFLTRRINHANRLRLEVRHFDDPMEESVGVMLQWTVILGAHDHGDGW